MLFEVLHLCQYKKKGARPVDINKRRVINGGDADVMQLYPMRHTFAGSVQWGMPIIGSQRRFPCRRILSSGKARCAFRRRTKSVEDGFGIFYDGRFDCGEQCRFGVLPTYHKPGMSHVPLRQAYEEAIHTHSYQYIVESLGLDESEIFNMYREVEAIYNKDAFILSFNEGILIRALNGHI